MGNGHEFLHMMIFFFSFFLFICFFTHILILDDDVSLAKNFIFLEENSNGDVKEKTQMIQKFIGRDESEEKQRFVLEKVRVLLGLQRRSFKFNNGGISPSPSPNIAGKFNFMGGNNNGDGKEKTQVIQKVSGEDESEEKQGLVLEKVRVLLGLQSRRFKFNNGGISISPSPSTTIEAPASSPSPAPAPVHPMHHPHRPLPPFRSSSSTRIPKPQKKMGHKNGARRTRIVVAVVVVSVAATFVISLLGFICFCRKFRKHRKRSSTKGGGRKSRGGSRSSMYNASRSCGNSVKKKVSFNPGMDLFYLNTIDMDLEQHAATSCLKQEQEQEEEKQEICENVGVFSDQNPENFVNENEDSENLEGKKSVFDDVSSCSSSIREEEEEEIVSVHDHERNESSKFDEIIHDEDDGGDDESFHSFCDSHSSNDRFSNASSTMEKMSPNGFGNSPFQPTSPASNAKSYPPHSPFNLDQKIRISLKSPKDELIPPPPPPPPPPPFAHISPPFSSPPTRNTSKVSCSSTLPNSSTNPSSSSGFNQNPPQSDLHSKPCNPLQPALSSPSVPPPPPPPFLKGNGNSIKPPPPPPPFLKGNGNSIKTPPPLPCQQQTPLGKDGTPLPKLKPLHWDKVRAAPDHSMVWDKLRSNSFELNEEKIESLFGYNLQNSMKNDEAKSKTPSPSKHVLDPKRLQNITILSKALNVTADQVCNALIQGDGLCLQQLEALVKMAPTKEEQDKLFSYNGNANELGTAENFVKAMLDVPFAFLRIEAMLYRETFEDEVVHLRKSFSMLEEACKELRSSRLFLKLLEAVLKTGNRMNVGTIRGGARAFKLDALLKLSDVKGTDGKTTLLHFVVQEMIRSEGIRESETIVGRMNQRRKTVQEREEEYRKTGLDLVSGLSNELNNVKKTATIDIDVLASSVSNLSDGMTKLQQLVQNVDSTNGKFVSSMKSFLEYAEKNLKEMKEYEEKVLLRVREITEYFHGNVSKDEANPLRIFVIVRDFLGVLDHVCKELRSSKVPSSHNPLAPFR